jgi:MFS family permease
MVVNLVLLPLLGPLGDNFSRKKIIVIADLTRFAVSVCLAGMFFSGYFNLRLLAGLYIASSMGNALFVSVESGIIPQIVPSQKLQNAFQQSYALTSLGGVAGGIAGGVIVSWLGAGGAFAFDAFSFLVAALCSNLIRGSTTPRRKKRGPALKPLAYWSRELLDGFRILLRIPVLFWLSIVAMLINFGLAPLSVALPVFAKLARHMPAWYLGAMESSLALGAIWGSLGLNRVQNLWKGRTLLMVSTVMMGLGVLVLPWSPGLWLPFWALLGTGIGSSLANIQFYTQTALVIPDSHRSRFNSIIEFLCAGLSPLGVAAAGWVIAQWGLSPALWIMGGLVILLTPLIALIPHLNELMTVRAPQAKGFLKKYYPGVIR